MRSSERAVWRALAQWFYPEHVHYVGGDRVSKYERAKQEIIRDMEDGEITIQEAKHQLEVLESNYERWVEDQASQDQR